MKQYRITTALCRLTSLILPISPAPALRKREAARCRRQVTGCASAARCRCQITGCASSLRSSYLSRWGA
ncbi:hypothetical protein, partial [Victivallis vadensis]|uniref:hypothetical protein n=1 Tax=Victivallis vadensis TaxID=172901 RepID=UPI001980B119